MKRFLLAALFAIAGSQTSLATAQSAPDAEASLAACVTGSVSGDDSVTTARWLFIAMSRHPSLPQGARIGDSEGLEANRQMGALVNRLLLESCATETRTAIAALGSEGAIGIAFNVLGQKAMADLMTNPDVMASAMQLGAYVDQQRLGALATVQ